ncbi:hypothetical protein ACFXKI_18365 [Streptomyces mirabilis]|uniref:hypothetical protein n=1 Tax=Streptomyces mirabilis TaxID=68239 RepID=UPI0036804C65
MSAGAAPSGRLALSNNDLETLSVNGQRSFHQLIHQGTELIPVHLIGLGRTEDEVRAEGTVWGATPSTSGESSSARCLLSRSAPSPRARPTTNADPTRPRTRTRLGHERADPALPHAQGLGGATWRQTSPCSSG